MSLQRDNIKRNSIIESGKELFWKFGIKRVSVEEICREAKVSKMTFYKNFPNKTELAKFILITNIDQAFGMFEEVMNGDLGYKEKVEFIIQSKVSAADKMSNEFFKEVWTDHSSPLFEMIQSFQGKSNQVFVDFLKKGQKSGDIRKDMKIEFVIQYTNSLTSLYENEEFVSQYASVQELTEEIINFLFYGISER